MIRIRYFLFSLALNGINDDGNNGAPAGGGNQYEMVMVMMMMMKHEAGRALIWNEEAELKLGGKGKVVW